MEIQSVDVFELFLSKSNMFFTPNLNPDNILFAHMNFSLRLDPHHPETLVLGSPSISFTFLKKGGGQQGSFSQFRSHGGPGSWSISGATADHSHTP